MTATEREELLADEQLIVRHSGELPEIALHASLYYLSQNPEGPEIQLTPQEQATLQDAAMDRFLEILLRDLNPLFRDLPLYRGVQRAIDNWNRFQIFCQRIERDSLLFQEQLASALVELLRCHHLEMQTQGHSPTLNCSPADLHSFVAALCVESSQLPADLHRLCNVCKFVGASDEGKNSATD